MKRRPAARTTGSRATPRRRPSARPNPGRAAGQPREVRASARYASLAVVCFARAWLDAARDAHGAGAIDADYFRAVWFALDGPVRLLSPDAPAPDTALGSGPAFRAALHRDADRLPFAAFLARVAALLEEDADGHAAEESFAGALARREFAAWLRTGKSPSWMARGAMARWPLKGGAW